jgi:hypothetical protein
MPNLYKLKLFGFLFLLVIGVAACRPASDCEGEMLCQQKNTRIINAVTELNKIGQEIHCTEGVHDIRKQVETIVDRFEDAHEIAALAAIARSLQNYENNEIPTCFNNRSDQAFDHAFWISVKKLSKSSDGKSREYLKKLKESSNLISNEKLYFDEILEQ